MSVFDVLKSNSRLASHSEKAKKAVATKDYNGPDGNVWCYLNRFQSGTKDGTPWFIFEFKVYPDEKMNPGLNSEFGAKLVIFIGLGDTEYQSAEEGMDNLFECIQLLGIVTSNNDGSIRDDAEIEAELNAIRKSRKPIELKTQNRKGKKGMYRNNSVIGLGEEGSATVSYEPENEETFLGDLADNGDTDAETKLWELAEQVGLDPNDYNSWREFEVAAHDALASSSSEPSGPLNSEQYTPSEWVGYDVEYDGESYTVYSADDDGASVTLLNSDGEETESISFNDIILPPEE